MENTIKKLRKIIINENISDKKDDIYFILFKFVRFTGFEPIS